MLEHLSPELVTRVREAPTWADALLKNRPALEQEGRVSGLILLRALVCLIRNEPVPPAE